MKRTWQLAEKITQDFKNQFPEINPIVLQLLYNRGRTTQAEIDEFLNPDYGQDIHDPFLFREMGKAVDRIFQAIEAKELITVHGDYDADGVCATVIVTSVLKALGASVNVYIPHRMSEGYGLNSKSVAELAKQGTKLIVTVDCGISNHLEIDEARVLGVDVVVTDHHEAPPKLPRAVALVNPNVPGETYPFKKLAGSGVAFKLAQAIISRDQGKRVRDGFEKWLLDLVAIGTIGDCVPLVGENRTLSRYGLVVLRKTKLVGLRELAEHARINLESVDSIGVSFGIVPRLNAAGRIDHANTAYELLSTVDEAHAAEVAEKLEGTNKQRQRTTEQMLNESKRQVGQVGDERLLHAIGPGWSAGLVGLVAGRLMDEYSRPVLVMGERDGEVVGSGRSIPAFDVTAALIKSSEYLDRYGGHAAACGFTVKHGQAQAFIEKMKALAAAAITPQDMVKRLFIDAELKLKSVEWDLVAQLEGFEPFGEGNKAVRFLSTAVEVTDLQKVGADSKHLRLVVQQGGDSRKLIAFGSGQTWGNELKIGDMIDVVYELSIHEWNGNRDLQLKLVDLRFSPTESTT